MKEFSIKQLLPYIGGVFLFAVLAFVYFYPVVEGYRIKQSDIKLGKGMSQEIRDHREVLEEEPLWLGNMFSGMPTFQVSTEFPGNLLQYVSKALTRSVPHPVGIVFAYMIGFFIFSLSLRINPYISIVGAIAYGFSSYFIIILEAGHNTKALALAYVPAMLAGIITMYRGKELLGFVITALFVGLELYANHFQITYYSLMIIIGIGIVNLISYLREKNIAIFARRSVLLLAAAVLGVGANVGNLLTTYEYSKSSTRSKSELTIQPDGSPNATVKSSGLDKDYITQWSYGKQESFSLLLSNVKGGSSGAIIGSEEEVERLRKEDPGFFNFLVTQYNQKQHVVSTYWGNQPFTSGPVYVGIIVFILAILALFFVKNKLIAALSVVTILALMLSWGKNSMWLTEFFIDYVPVYNKFRAVAMLLVIVEFTLPVFAVLFISELYNNRDAIIVQKKKLFIVSGGMLAMLLILWMSPVSFFDFISDKENSIFAQQIAQDASAKNSIEIGISQLTDYRVDIVQSDIIRAIQFLLGLFLIIGLYLYGKLNRNVLVLLIGVLLLADLWSVDKRYFNNDTVEGAGRNSKNKYEKYELPEINNSPYQASGVDYAILQQETALNPAIAQKINDRISEEKSEKRRLSKLEQEKIQFTSLMRNSHYRVLNTSSRMDEDAGTAYFHKTLGGYHAAKMKKYQELIDFQLGSEHFQLRQAFSQGGVDLVKRYLPQTKITNMLNAKYIMGVVSGQQGQQLTYLENPNALGNAWFVNEVKEVKNANDEILQLRDIDPATTAVIQESEGMEVGNSFAMSAGDNITLTSYLPNELKYNYSATKEQFAVFSEVFYKDGWTVTVNEKEDQYFKVNYVLRGMKVPAGNGEIVFKFEPQSYVIGEAVSLTSSIIILLVLAIAIYRMVKGNQTEQLKG
ncbi:MAG: YfhO family protein [Vicingaceae bacterium]